MHREIILETSATEGNGPRSRLSRGISVRTPDNHFQAAFHSMRYQLTQGVDVFTDVDRSLRKDRVEESGDRDDVSRWQRASGKRDERSTSEGERSNFEGERGKSSRKTWPPPCAGATSAASPAKS